MQLAPSTSEAGQRQLREGRQAASPYSPLPSLPPSSKVYVFWCCPSGLGLSPLLPLAHLQAVGRQQLLFMKTPTVCWDF